MKRKGICLPVCAIGMSLLAISSQAIEPAETVLIWEGIAPGEKTRKTGDKLPPRETDQPTITRVENITMPTLDIYPVADPQKASGAGVLILPGGGFGRVVPDLEGSEAAEWLNDLGIAAFVLNYRTTTGADEKITKDPWLRPAQDSMRAIQWIRAKAENWNLDPEKVGLLGFSAGGQVAAIHASTGPSLYTVRDGIDREERHRPSFLLLIYPWQVADEETEVLMEPIKIDEYMPPSFIVHTDDDKSSSLGAALIYLGLKKHKVSGELHIYQNGGHGYGTRDRPNSVIGTWTDRGTDWLRLRGLTHAAPLAEQE
jgi:acetyl esterase/lipase